MYQLVFTLVEQFKAYFSNLLEKQDFVTKTIKREEENFYKTLDKGIALFNKVVSNQSSKRLSGKITFELYDTYGFPFDLTSLMAKELGIEVDKESFDLEMKAKKKSSKEQRVSTIDNDLSEIISDLKIKSSIYIGDNNKSNESLLLNIIQDNKIIDSLKTEEEGILIFSRNLLLR